MIRVNQENQLEIKETTLLEDCCDFAGNFCNEIHFKTRLSRDFLPMNN